MRIAIITGGSSGERDISIRSAENVRNAINFAETKTFVFPEDKDTFIQTHAEFDVAIPVIHGAGGEDGEVQSLLEELSIPFPFSNIETHRVCIDKRTTKSIVDSLDIKTPKEISATTPEFPLFAKPNFGGSSVASKYCNTKEELESLVSNNTDTDFILEEPIKGTEYTVGVLEYGGQTLPLPAVMIVPQGDFFDFESKYDPDHLASEVFVKDKGLETQLQKLALAIHHKLRVRDCSRSDFIVTTNGDIYFLEINTIPGMTNTSIYPKMIQEAGYNLTDVIQSWVMKLKRRD